MQEIMIGEQARSEQCTENIIAINIEIIKNISSLERACHKIYTVLKNKNKFTLLWGNRD